jgi:hypothetical protein
MTVSSGRIAAAFGATALAVQPVPGSSQAACISEAEVSALAVFLVPSLVEVVRERCADRLQADGFLSRDGDALVARYAALLEAVWPEAKAGFVKFAEADTKREREEADAMANLPDAGLQPLIEAVIAEEAAKSIRPADCSRIERLVASLAPIEPRAAGNLVAVIASLSGLDEPSVCPPEES